MTDTNNLIDSGSSKDDPNDSNLEQKLNLETGRIKWTDLQTHFARGVVLVVDVDLDLVEIAASFMRDDHRQISKLLGENKIVKPDINKAQHWHNDKQEFWAVVVAPWVLIQEIVSS